MSGLATAREWASERFELNRGGADHNLRSMEGLRGLAVFLVFLSHYGTLMRPWITDHEGLLALTFRLVHLGGSGVDLFFLLSGFLIYGSLIGRQQEFVPYFKRRLARLYPAFTAVFAAYVLLSFTFASHSKIPEGFGAAMGYLAVNFAMLPGIVPVEPMITVAWSLSYEITYYLAIPAVIAVLGLRSWSPAKRVRLFALLSLGAFGLFSILGGPVRLITFLAGILLHEQLASRPGRGPSSWMSLAALLLALASTQCTFGGTLGYATRVAILYLAFYFVCAGSFGRPKGNFARSLCATPLRWLGNMSYSYYLVHSLALHAALAVIGLLVPKEVQGPAVFFALLPLLFLWTLIVSAGLFLFVERPFSLAKRSRAR